MLTCKGPSAVENREKNLESMATVLKDLDTSPALTKTIIGGLRHAHNSTTPSVREYGYVDFGGGITLGNIIEDQTNLGGPIFSVVDEE